MKYLFAFIIALLSAVILYLWFNREHELKDIDVTQLTELRTELKRAETKRMEIITKAREDSAKHDSITMAKDKEIARLKRAVRKSKTVHVDTVILEDKEVGTYIQYLDSVVSSQDSYIVELKDQKAVTWQNFNELIGVSDSVNNAYIQLNKHFQSSLEEANTENKKLARQNKILKIGIVAIPSAVIGVLILAK